MKAFQKRYEQLETVWKRSEKVVIIPEHDWNHFELGGKTEYIWKDKKESKEVKNENPVYDAKLSA